MDRAVLFYPIMTRSEYRIYIRLLVVSFVLIKKNSHILIYPCV